VLHAGSTADPALVSGSLYRHVRIVVEPDGSGERVTVYLSSLTPKKSPSATSRRCFRRTSKTSQGRPHCLAQFEPQARDAITYLYTFTNTGDVPVTELSIAETSFSGSGVLPPATCAASELTARRKSVRASTSVTRSRSGFAVPVNQATRVSAI